MDYTKMYQSLKEKVDSLSLKEDEKKRIMSEEELFASRGWEEYIALALDIINRVDKFPLLEDTVGGDCVQLTLCLLCKEHKKAPLLR